MAQHLQRLTFCFKGCVPGPLQSIWAPGSKHIACITSTALSRCHISCQYKSKDVRPTPVNNYELGFHGNWCYQPVRFAGHSHWHNTRHIKMANEKIRSKVNTKIVQKIQLALRGEGCEVSKDIEYNKDSRNKDIKIITRAFMSYIQYVYAIHSKNISILAGQYSGANADPKLNRDLERAIEEGKSSNVPLTLMMDAVKRITQGLEKGASINFEARGMGSSFYIIECFTDRPSHTRNSLKFIAKKCGAEMVEAGRATHSFEFKGLVHVKPDETKPLDMDEATEVAIEAGAEEVTVGMNDEGDEMLQFYCDPKELHDVKTALVGRELVVTESRFAYVPITYVKLSGMELKYAGEMLDLLSNHEEVVRVYDNVESAESEESTS